MAKATNAEEFIAELEEFAKDNQPPDGESWDGLKSNVRARWRLSPDDFWKHREQIRSRVGIYPSFQFHTEEYAGIIREIRSDYPHWYIHPSTNKDQPGMIAYTKNDEAGRRDVQVATKIGKFLKSFDRFGDQFINDMANEYKTIREQHANDSYGLHFTDDPSEMVDIYRLCTTGSCMSYDASRWKLRMLENEHLTEQQLALLRASLQREMLHPVALYGLIDHIKLAYLVQPKGVVGRALVNTEKKKYIRAYGNDQLKRLLNRKGYTCGHIAPLDMPYVEVESPTGKGILAPYFDQHNETPVKAAVHVPTKTCRVSVEGNLMLNHYSTAYLPVDANRTCTSCGTLSNTRLMEHTNEQARELEYYCTPCSRTVVEKLFEDQCIGVMFRNGVWDIVADHPSQFFHYPFQNDSQDGFIKGILRSDAPMYRLANDLHVMGTFLQLYLNSIAADDTDNREIAEHILSRVHINNRKKFRYDAITGELRFKHDMDEVTMPDGTEGLTARRRLRLKQPGSVLPVPYSLDLYERGHYPELGDVVQLDHRIYRSLGNKDVLYIRRSDCVEAIINRAKDTVLAPPQACTYAVATDQWFVSRATRGRFLVKKLDSEDLKALELTSTDIRLRASRLVKAYIPYELTEVGFHTVTEHFDYWQRWVEEVHLSVPSVPQLHTIANQLNERGITTNAQD